ncbi:hypothetical protein ACQ4M3_32050 [Leptolyngbya sp. AN03gr2]
MRGAIPVPRYDRGFHVKSAYYHERDRQTTIAPSRIERFLRSCALR